MGTLTRRNCRVGNVRNFGCTARDVRHNMRKLAKPTVTSHFEKVCSFARVGHQYPSQKIASMRCHVFRERQRCTNNILVQQIDVIAIWICWIIIERQIASQHSILSNALACHPEDNESLCQLTKITPQLQTSTLRPVYSESLTTSSGAA